MPGIFDIKNKTLDELQQEADSHFEKQTSDFDKFWYYLNVTALEKAIADAKEKLKEPDSTDLDKEYDDPEEERKALEQVKKNDPDRYFQDEERERLTVPGDEKTDDKAYDLNHYVEEKLDDEVFNPVTLNDLKKCYQMQGMMMAKIAIEMQKEYEEKLKLFPENDPHRKQKAEFLQMNDTHSKVMSMDNALKNYIAHFNMNNNTLTENMLADSPIPDIEAMKKLSMKAFLDDTMTSREDQKKFFEERKRLGLNIDENTSVYDAYLIDFNHAQEQIAAKNPGYKKKKATDHKIAELVRNDYHLRLMTYQQRFGNEIVKNALKPEDREKTDYGIKMYSWKEYSAPKEIRDWAETEGRQLLRKNRVDQINANYEYFGKELETEKPFGLTKSGVLGEVYKEPARNASAYEKFYHAHLGPRALFDETEERKEHLSLVMAARTAQASHEEFSLKTITRLSSAIRNSPGFKNLTDRDLRVGLLDRNNALEVHKKVIEGNYGVPKNDQADYIRKMGELSKAMIPGRGQSAAYRRLHRAVKGISGIDPNDPKADFKMMQANEEMLRALLSYQKGKKSLRTYTDSQKRFDNSLDVLSIMNAYVPGFKQYAKEQVDKINLVRKVNEGDKDFVDLQNFGVERAKIVAPKTIAISAPHKDLIAPSIISIDKPLSEPKAPEIRGL